jgi:hypothetical protein
MTRQEFAETPDVLERRSPRLGPNLRAFDTNALAW